MGLLDFAANIGKKLFPSNTKPEDASAKIKTEIENAKLGITGLNVALKDGVCSLSGECPDFIAYQKAILIAGNIEGVANVDAKNFTIKAAAQAPAEQQTQYYIIQKGDNLSKIAKQFYGDANKYPEIFAANKEVIQDPDKIFPGQKIRIPPKKA